MSESNLRQILDMIEANGGGGLDLPGIDLSGATR